MRTNTAMLRDAKRPSAMEFLQICRFETSKVSTFAPRTFFQFGCFSIHVTTKAQLQRQAPLLRSRSNKRKQRVWSFPLGSARKTFDV